MPFYRISGLGHLFDGLIVCGEKSTSPCSRCSPDYVDVTRVQSSNVVFGDREFKIELPPETVYISTEVLTPIEDPGIREFDHKNPWGKFIHEGSYSTPTENGRRIELRYARHERIVQGTLLECFVTPTPSPQRTLLSLYVKPEHFAEFRECAEKAFNGDTVDADDIVLQFAKFKR